MTTAAIKHQFHGASHETAAKNPHFIITNQNGDYLALGNPNHSNYDGLFFKSAQSYFKTIANIASQHETTSLLLHDDFIERKISGSTQQFFLHEDGLLLRHTIHNSEDAKPAITLDCKQLYDESDTGRIYSVEESIFHASDTLGDLHILRVRYTKYIDDTRSATAYELCLCIASTSPFARIDRWRNAQYEYDNRRKSHYTPWVYDLATIEQNGDTAIALGQNNDEAQWKAVGMLLRRQKIIQQIRSRSQPPTLPAKAQPAWRALATLKINNGMYAGLPWFFQYWSRDELTCCGGLLAAGQYDLVVKIIDRWFSVVRHDGTLPAIFPDKGLESSDAPGWLGKRVMDLINSLSAKNRLGSLSHDTLVRWRDHTGIMLDHIVSRMRDGLLWSGYNTTWMDTSKDDDGRSGARIEIQALLLALVDAHALLCTITRHEVAEKRKIAWVVRENAKRFVSGDVLLDGLYDNGSPDFTVRPNIFLAWYIAPDLFVQQEWEKFFSSALPKIWLPWGGVSSVAKDDWRFCPTYTGEDVASYHRGDSWYFINNIVAMALHSVNPAMFASTIQQIVAASEHDLLTLGYIGHCSEVSSASVQEAAGCHAQAWSASTLIELQILLDK